MRPGQTSDPLYERVELTDFDASVLLQMPWASRRQQTVGGRPCAVLEIDGQRVRLVVLDGERPWLDGAADAVRHVMFWVRS